MSGRGDDVAGALGDVRFLVVELWRMDRRALVLALLESGVSLAKSAAPVAYALVVSGLAAHRPAPAIGGLLWLLLVHGLGLRVEILGIDARLALSDRMRNHFDRRIAAMSAQLPTTDHLVDPEVLDRLELIIAQQGALGGAANSLLNAVRSFVWPAAGLTIALVADWRMVFPALAAVPLAWSSTWQVRWQREAEERSAVHERACRRLLDTTLAPSGAAELRIFGAQGFLVDRLTATARRWRHPFLISARRSAAVTTGLTVLYFVVAAVVLGWLTRDAVAGVVSVGSLTMAITSTGQLRENFTTVRFGVDQVSSLLRTVSRYRWFERYTARVMAEHPGSLPPPGVLRSGIELQGVTHRHPGQEGAALHDVTLRLPAGATVALVGENGAGKSTLVGLLTGMIDPTQGRVVVDGTDLAAIDLVQWRQRCAGAFQDHLRPEVTAYEAVGLGDEATMTDVARVESAAALGTATELLATLPAGPTTQLGAQWPEGVDLSGGQWQRLALARGMMRESPLLLVLDEPTAALDPVAEDRLFTRYAEASRRAGGGGGITVLVTHRFSTVTAADLVVVLHEGRVEEVGTHRELLAANGRYAELYQLQARGYG